MSQPTGVAYEKTRFKTKQSFLDKYDMINIYRNEHATKGDWDPKLTRRNKWLALQNKTVIAGKSIKVGTRLLRILVKVRGKTKWEYFMADIPKDAGLKKIIVTRRLIRGELKDMLEKALKEGKDYPDYTNYELAVDIKPMGAPRGNQYARKTKKEEQG